MAIESGYSPRHRAERVISAGRLFLAAFLLLAVLLDPTEPGRYATLVRWLAFSYLLYAGGVTLLTWTSVRTAAGLPLITQVVDLVLFSAFMHFTEGPTSPFFVYFVFATICGAIRWHARGALWTGAAALAAYIGVTLAGTAFLGSEPFEPARFIARCTHLAIVAGLLAYLGEYQHRLYREIEQLAAWPRRLPAGEADALQEVLTYAAGILRTPRVVLVWEEGEEPSLRVASKAADRFESSREPPDVFGSVVAEPLERSSFLCSDASAATCEVLQRVPGGFRLWRGAPLDPIFRERYAVTSVLALRVATDSVQGRLFALDRSALSTDDVLLGDIVVRFVTGALELQVLLQQLRESAAGEERLRLARELHDGVLQALTAAALQAQRTREKLTTDPGEAEDRLARLEETILAEQQALRVAIQDLQPGGASGMLTLDLAERLRQVAAQVARQWEIRVDLDVSPDRALLPGRLVHEISRMLQEALVNAVRHGGAKQPEVICTVSDEAVRLAVAYKGRGFTSFRGRHDLASLEAMKAGPRTLKERVSALGGELVIDSGDEGARVEITIALE